MTAEKRECSTSFSLSLSRFSSFVRLPAEIYDETRTHSPTSFVWFVLLSFFFPPLYFSDDTNNYGRKNEGQKKTRVKTLDADRGINETELMIALVVEKTSRT